MKVFKEHSDKLTFETALFVRGIRSRLFLSKSQKELHLQSQEFDLFFSIFVLILRTCEFLRHKRIFKLFYSRLHFFNSWPASILT
jgi:hypothetical protein